MNQLKYNIILLLALSTNIIVAKELTRANVFNLKNIEKQTIPNQYPNNKGNQTFPLITKYDAELEKVSSTIEFNGGTDPKITFRVINLSFNTLKVREWMMKEHYNLIIYYTPIIKNGEKPPPLDKWKILKPDTGKTPRRMPLMLKYRNSVLLSVNLSFIKDLNIKVNKNYYIMAQLNLTSLPLKSRIFSIKIKPNLK